MLAVFKEDNMFLPSFQFKINENLYPHKIEQIILRETKKCVEDFAPDTARENAKSACTYVAPLLEADSENFYALFLGAMSDPFCSDGDTLDVAFNAVGDYKRALELAREKLGQTKEYYDFCTETSTCFAFRLSLAVILLTMPMATLASKIDEVEKQLRNMVGDDPRIQHERQVAENNRRSFQKTCADRSMKFEKMYVALFRLLGNWLEEQPIDKISDSALGVIEWIIQIKDYAPKIQSPAMLNFLSVSDKEQKDFETLCGKRLDEIHKWRVAKYWEAHPEEKAEIEGNIEHLKRQIEALEGENAAAQVEIKDKITEEEKKRDRLEEDFRASKNKMLEAINAMEKDKSKQGLFAFGAKKDLKNKIEEQQSAIYTLEREYADKIDSLEEKIDTIKQRGRTVDREFSEKISSVRAQIEKSKNTLANKEQ